MRPHLQRSTNPSHGFYFKPANCLTERFQIGSPVLLVSRYLIQLSYWGDGRRRPAGRSLEKCLLCHRSTINYSNLQMAFNVGWNRKGLSFVRVFAVIGPTRFPIPCTQQVGARGGGGVGVGRKSPRMDGSLPMVLYPCKFSPLLVECEEQTGCHCDKSRCTIEFAVGWCSESHFQEQKLICHLQRQGGIDICWLSPSFLPPFCLRKPLLEYFGNTYVDHWSYH